jgi:hypothetical protein
VVAGLRARAACRDDDYGQNDEPCQDGPPQRLEYRTHLCAPFGVFLRLPKILAQMNRRPAFPTLQ